MLRGQINKLIVNPIPTGEITITICDSETDGEIVNTCSESATIQFEVDCSVDVGTNRIQVFDDDDLIHDDEYYFR